MTDRGIVGYMTTSSSLGRFFWNITDLTRSATVGDFYWSPEIEHLDNVWQLRIYPQGTKSIPSWIILQVFRTNVSAGKPVHFSLGVYKNRGSEEKIMHSEGFHSDTCFSSGLIKLIRRRNLLKRWKEFAYLDLWSVIFTIWIDEQTSVEGRKLDESEKKELKDSSDKEDHRAYYDPKGRKPDLVEPKKKELKDSSDREEDFAYYDPEGRKLDLVEPKKKELKDSSDKEEDFAYYDPEGRKPVFVEPKKKELKDSSDKEDFAYYDPEGGDPTLRKHWEDMLVARDDHDGNKVTDQ